MTAALALLYISAISFVGAHFFAAVDWLKPNPCLAISNSATKNSSTPFSAATTCSNGKEVESKLEGGALYGFMLYDQKGVPCVSLGYKAETETNAGRDHVLNTLDTIANAEVSFTSLGDP